MKLALICSPTDFETIEWFSLGYHMVLAQHVLNNTAYANYFAEKHQQGHFIILDNGAAEGVSLPFNKVVQAADIVGADEIALQDVMFNGPDTVGKHLETRALLPPNKRMIIPQGRSWDEWTQCLKNLTMNVSYRSIGVPKHLEQLSGGRVKALSIIHDFRLHREHDVHLLGCYRNPVQEILNARRAFPWVRGIDTAAPFAYSQNNAMVTRDEHYSYVWNERGFDRLTHDNVILLRDACMGVEHASPNGFK